jgi:hypothetical protein
MIFLGVSLSTKVYSKNQNSQIFIVGSSKIAKNIFIYTKDDQ